MPDQNQQTVLTTLDRVKIGAFYTRADDVDSAKCVVSAHMPDTDPKTEVYAAVADLLPEHAMRAAPGAQTQAPPIVPEEPAVVTPPTLPKPVALIFFGPGGSGKTLVARKREEEADECQPVHVLDECSSVDLREAVQHLKSNEQLILITNSETVRDASVAYVKERGHDVRVVEFPNDESRAAIAEANARNKPYLDALKKYTDADLDAAYNTGHDAGVAQGTEAMSDNARYAKTPDYYKVTIRGVTFDCDDVIEALGFGFRAGNALKYLWRAGRKTETTELSDLRKAQHYIERVIAEVSK